MQECVSVGECSRKERKEAKAESRVNKVVLVLLSFKML